MFEMTLFNSHASGDGFGKEQNLPSADGFGNEHNLPEGDINCKDNLNYLIYNYISHFLHEALILFILNITECH